MSPSANSHAPDFLVIGTPEDRRVTLFQQALMGLGMPAARLLSYRNLIEGDVQVADLLTPTTIVRIESPSKSMETERLLLTLGTNEPDPEGEGHERLAPSVLAELPFEKGRLLSSRPVVSRIQRAHAPPRRPDPHGAVDEPSRRDLAHVR